MAEQWGQLFEPEQLAEHSGKPGRGLPNKEELEELREREGPIQELEQQLYQPAAKRSDSKPQPDPGETDDEQQHQQLPRSPQRGEVSPPHPAAFAALADRHPLTGAGAGAEAGERGVLRGAVRGVEPLGRRLGVLRRAGERRGRAGRQARLRRGEKKIPAEV